jgi:hypothetical protein
MRLTIALLMVHAVTSINQPNVNSTNVFDRNYRKFFVASMTVTALAWITLLYQDLLPAKGKVSLLWALTHLELYESQHVASNSWW